MFVVVVRTDDIDNGGTDTNRTDTWNGSNWFESVNALPVTIHDGVLTYDPDHTTL